MPLFQGHLTLRLRIEPLGEGRYRATTSGGGRGQQWVEFTLPLADDERERWLERFRRPFDRSQGDRWRLLEEFGSALFERVFRKENLATWRLLREDARRENRLLRLVLDLPDERLQTLPWEALYDPVERHFIARDGITCILRYPRDPVLPTITPPQLPLRILAVISTPRGTPALDVEGEVRLLEGALGERLRGDEVELEWIDGRERPATLGRIARALTEAVERGQPFDVLHYIGHATWRGETREGALLLEGGGGGPEPTTASSLGEVMRRGALRLAVLNACEGSRIEEAAPFRSVAATLLTVADLPAVIANQIEITDRSAKAFARAFYGALAERRSVEAAVVAARETIGVATTLDPEWVATIFFSRYPDDGLYLLPPRTRDVVGSHPMRTATLLFVLTALMGITVVSILRAYGLLLGVGSQLVFWALALWFVHDRWAHIRRFYRHVLGALLVATVAVGAWFLWQPTVAAPAPPPDFALSLTEPSPLVPDDQARRVALSLDVRGRVFNLPEGQRLWILVRADNAATYAAGAPAEIDAEGNFVAREVIVGPSVAREVGDRRYTVQPVLVDDAGHRFLLTRRDGFWRFFHPDFRVDPEPRLQRALVIRR